MAVGIGVIPGLYVGLGVNVGVGEGVPEADGVEVGVAVAVGPETVAETSVSCSSVGCAFTIQKPKLRAREKRRREIEIILVPLDFLRIALEVE